jgi:hypothetical protein
MNEAIRSLANIRWSVPDRTDLIEKLRKACPECAGEAKESLPRAKAQEKEATARPPRLKPWLREGG